MAWSELATNRRGEDCIDRIRRSGTVTTTTATAETTSTAQNVNVGDGAVTADVLKADAHSFTDGTTFTFSEAGPTFVNLVINGQLFGGSPPPNTKIKLPGLGTLWLNRVIQTPNSIEVRMIELIVSQNNSLGIPRLGRYPGSGGGGFGALSGAAGAARTGSSRCSRSESGREPGSRGAGPL
jgi:hypothetical protein